MELSKQLDNLNLEVAKYRAKKGMSLKLTQLYGRMGSLSSEIRAIEEAKKKILIREKEADETFNAICETFAQMDYKEKPREPHVLYLHDTPNSDGCYIHKTGL